jgi:hypothetical protein
MLFKLTPSILLPTFAVTALAWVCSPIKVEAQSMMDQMILSKCSSAMTSDFAKAGKPVPEGLIPKTCNCVLTTYKQTRNLDTAKQTCSQQAMQSQSQPQN